MDNTLSPVYNETFHFQGPEIESDSILRIRVFDKDMFSDDLLTKLDLPLGIFREGKRTETWHKLCAPKATTAGASDESYGDIDLEIEVTFHTRPTARKGESNVRLDDRQTDLLAASMSVLSRNTTRDSMEASARGPTAANSRESFEMSARGAGSTRSRTAARDDEDRLPATVSILGKANARMEAGNRNASTRNDDEQQPRLPSTRSSSNGTWQNQEDKLARSRAFRDNNSRFRDEQNDATDGRYGFFESCLGDIFTPALIAHVCRLFGKADADGSGTINGTEMVTVVQELYMATGSELPCDDELRKSVRRLHFSFDRDSSGSLSQAEFCTLLRKSPFASSLSQRWRTQTNKADSAAPSAHPSPLSSPRVASHQR